MRSYLVSLVFMINCDVAVQYVSHYITWIVPFQFEYNILLH